MRLEASDDAAETVAREVSPARWCRSLPTVLADADAVVKHTLGADGAV